MTLSPHTTLAQLRATRKALRGSGKRIAFVPTMGALHAGHLALVAAAKQHADAVVVSIFVNPKQFGPAEDLARYPRTLEADRQALEALGVEVLYVPSVEEMYSDGFASLVHVEGLGERWCGAHRPGHFDGVTTVVAKLFQQVQPDVALFGEKDFQQLTIIRRMVRDLDFSLEIIGVPTVREADGLAMSSRNQYLSAEARAIAPALYQAISDAAQSLRAGAPVAATLQRAQEDMLAKGFAKIDYCALCDAHTLAPLTALKPDARLLVAAHLEHTRLIDNIKVA